jgi:ABC-type transport system involved in multi-copper enzyme maturation permease subunit
LSQVDDMLAQEKAGYEEELARQETIRATYAFPASITTLLGSAIVVYLFALLLLTATTIGDEFSWGTIRTTLLASSNRPRWLAVRLGLIALTAVLALAVLVLLALVLPLAIVAVVGHLPQSPPVDLAALAVLLGGLAVTAFVLIGFAAASTVLMRSGGLTLVITLVWVLAESAVLALVIRLEPFRPENAFGDGKPAGPLAWALDLFPVHAFQDFLSTATQATGGAVNYGGEITTLPLAGTYLPLASLAAWAVIFVAIAVLRFDRMDIAE